MSDSLYQTFQHYGTNAERLAFTPDPPALATGEQPIYSWWVTDPGANHGLWVYDTGWTQVGGGGIAPAAGSDTEIQFNDGGVLGADPAFTWDTTASLFTVQPTYTDLSGDVVSVAMYPVFNPAVNAVGGAYAFDLYLLTGTDKTFTDVFAGSSQVDHSGTGAVSRAVGMSGSVGNGDVATITTALAFYGTINNFAAGTYTTAVDFYGRVNNASTGTITTGAVLYAVTPGNGGGGTLGTYYHIIGEDVSGVTVGTAKGFLNYGSGKFLVDSAGDLLMSGNYQQMTEMTAPSAPAANGVRIFARDNGGKTELCALFNSGAIQQIAIEP